MTILCILIKYVEGKKVLYVGCPDYRKRQIKQPHIILYMPPIDSFRDQNRFSNTAFSRHLLLLQYVL